MGAKLEVAGRGRRPRAGEGRQAHRALARRDHGDLGEIGMAPEGRLDLAQLDAVAPALHLPVRSSHEEQLAARLQDDTVPGPVVARRVLVRSSISAKARAVSSGRFQ